MAADSPLTAPWAYGPRGSMLGSSDHHQKSSAPAAPPNVGRRNSQPPPGWSRSRPAIVKASNRVLAHVHSSATGGRPPVLAALVQDTQAVSP